MAGVAQQGQTVLPYPHAGFDENKQYVQYDACDEYATHMHMLVAALGQCMFVVMMVVVIMFHIIANFLHMQIRLQRYCFFLIDAIPTSGENVKTENHGKVQPTMQKHKMKSPKMPKTEMFGYSVMSRKSDCCSMFLVVKSRITPMRPLCALKAPHITSRNICNPLFLSRKFAYIEKNMYLCAKIAHHPEK